MDALVVGDPFDPATDIGPIVTEAQRDELVGQVEEAAAPGGDRARRRRRCPTGDGWYFAPTVLSGVTTDMPVAQEEIFGPVAMVAAGARPRRPRSRRRTRRPSGWARACGRDDQGEAPRCIEGIEAGAVFVNAMVASTPELPFGGIKRSGFGRELSELGLKEFTNAKTVWIA